MKLRDIVQEAAMHRGSYERALRALGDDLLMGFEAEFVVPEDSDLYETGTSIEGKMGDFSDLKDLDDIEKYFDMSASEYSRLRHEMENYAEGELNDYVEEMWERFNDEDERDGRQQAIENWNDNHPDTFKLWIDGKYNDVQDMLSHHRISPRWPVPGDEDHFYLSEPPDDNEGTKQATFKNVVWALAKVVNDDVEVSFDKEPNKHQLWYVEPDTSIEYKGDFVGTEIVSPPLPATEMLVALEQVFDFAMKHDFHTNGSTGLHISFSVPDMAKRFNPLKFVLFFDERYALKLFGRENNTYTKPQLMKIVNALTMTGLPALDDLEMRAATLLSKDKYVAVNLGKLMKQGYVELRAAGGENYEYDLKTIKDMVGRIAVALQVALDPRAEKIEYARKLAKLADLVGKVRTPSMKIQTPYRGLDPLLNTDPDLQLHYEGLVNYRDMDALQRFLEALDRQLRRLGRRLSEKERVHIRLMLRKLNVSKTSAYDGQTFVVTGLLKGLGI